MRGCGLTIGSIMRVSMDSNGRGWRKQLLLRSSSGASMVVPSVGIWVGLGVGLVGVLLYFLPGGDASTRRLGFGLMGAGAVLVGVVFAWIGFAARRTALFGIYGAVPGAAIAIGGLWVLSEAISGEW